MANHRLVKYWQRQVEPGLAGRRRAPVAPRDERGPAPGRPSSRQGRPVQHARTRRPDRPVNERLPDDHVAGTEARRTAAAGVVPPARRPAPTRSPGHPACCRSAPSRPRACRARDRHARLMEEHARHVGLRASRRVGPRSRVPRGRHPGRQRAVGEFRIVACPRTQSGPGTRRPCRSWSRRRRPAYPVHVGLPPPPPSRHQPQCPVSAPRRLAHRLRGTTRDPPRRSGARSESVPPAVSVVRVRGKDHGTNRPRAFRGGPTRRRPAARPVGVHPRRPEEVVALEQRGLARLGATGRQCHHAPDRAVRAGGVHLAHRQDPVPVRRGAEPAVVVDLSFGGCHGEGACDGAG